MIDLSIVLNMKLSLNIVLPISDNDFVIAVMESQNQALAHDSEGVSMPLVKELMSNMNDMMKLLLQAKEGQQVVPSPSDNASKTTGDNVMQKLAKFKKFAPKSFKEASDPNEAEEWLEELDCVLETLKIEDGERMIYTESLLQGEARIWWKMEKQK